MQTTCYVVADDVVMSITAEYVNKLEEKVK